MLFLAIDQMSSFLALPLLVLFTAFFKCLHFLFFLFLFYLLLSLNVFISCPSTSSLIYCFPQISHFSGEKRSVQLKKKSTTETKIMIFRGARACIMRIEQKLKRIKDPQGVPKTLLHFLEVTVGRMTSTATLCGENFKVLGRPYRD